MKSCTPARLKYLNIAPTSIFFIAMFLLIPNLSFAAENNGYDSIGSIVTRDDGYHAVFFSSIVFTNSDGCDYADRAILLESDSVSRSMLAALLTAMMSQANVQIRTDGCEVLNSANSDSAPKIVKIKMSAPSS